MSRIRKTQVDWKELGRILAERRLTRKGFVGSAMAAVLAPLVAACGGGGDGEEATPPAPPAETGTAPAEPAEPAASTEGKVAFIVPSFTQIRWAQDQEAFEARATELGMEVLLQVSNDDEALQASQVENVLTQGIDVLVLAPVNVDTAGALVEQATAAGVPTISYNYLISNADVVAVVQRDSVEVGRALAQAAVDAVPEGNYVLVLGDEGTDVARLKADGLYSVIQPSIDAGAITVVAEQYNRGWSPESAQKQVENALTANANEIHAVLASNDGMAFGSIEALKGQGLAGSTYVTGEDAEPDALVLIKDGSMGVSHALRHAPSGRRD